MRLTSTVWTACGHTAFALGMIGVVLPIMPTAPFLILAAYCYSKGSPRFETWLLNHALFGPMILDWRDQGAIHPRAKLLSTVVLSTSMAMIVFVFSFTMWVKCALIAIMLCALTFILTRPAPKKP